MFRDTLLFRETLVFRDTLVPGTHCLGTCQSPADLLVPGGRGRREPGGPHGAAYRGSDWRSASTRVRAASNAGAPSLPSW